MDQNDKIESFFNKKFSQPVEAQEWNTPPEDSWDNILLGLEDKPSKRRYAIYLPWLFGIIALFVSSYLLITNKNNSERIQNLENRIDHIGAQSDKNTKTLDSKNTTQVKKEAEISSINGTTEQIENIETARQTLKTKKPNRTKNTIESSNAITQKSIALKDRKKIATNTTSDSTLANSSGTQNMIANSNSNIGNTIGNNGNNHIGSKNTETFALSDNNIQVPIINRSRENLGILAIAKLTDSLFPVPERNKVDVDDFLRVASRVELDNTPLAIYAGITSRYNRWIDVNSGLDPNPLEELRVDENTLSSFAHGVSASMALGKKWTGNIGLLYNQRNNQTDYLLQLPFSTNTEMLDSEGDLINAFQHSLPTALGDVKTDVTLARSQSSTLANNEIVGIDLSFQNRSKSLIIPLTTSYFFRAAHDGLYVSGGIVNEFTLSTELSDIQSTSLHNTVDDKIVDVQYNDEQINNYSVGASAGLGYVFLLNKGMNLTLGANYDFALNNNYTNGGFQHKVNNLSFGLNLMKAIR